MQERLHEIWNKSAKSVLETIDNQGVKPMTVDEFLSHCVFCGRNKNGTILSGIQNLYPEVYNAIPNHMGTNAFEALCIILQLLDIKFESEESL